MEEILELDRISQLLRIEVGADYSDVEPPVNLMTCNDTAEDPGQ